MLVGGTGGRGASVEARKIGWANGHLYEPRILGSAGGSNAAALGGAGGGTLW